MMLPLALLIAIVGFAYLAASLAKHHRDLFGRAPSRSVEKRLRIAGYLALSISLILSTSALGFAFGLILWTGLLSIAALTVALLLTYKNKWWRT